MDIFEGTNLNEITESDLQQLVHRSVPEDINLDYKRDLGHFHSPDKNRSRNARQEFLADVTAMANASGGLLLIGVDEERLESGQPTGVPQALEGIEVDNSDALIRQIEGVIQDGIDERIPGFIAIMTVPLANGT